jgi:hypothetical protein
MKQKDFDTIVEIIFFVVALVLATIPVEKTMNQIIPQISQNKWFNTFYSIDLVGISLWFTTILVIYFVRYIVWRLFFSKVE